MTRCAHCGSEVDAAVIAGGDAGTPFCCAGCAAAHTLVCDLDLADYYRRRALDPSQALTRPDGADLATDWSAFVRPNGIALRLDLMVDGLQCAACVWLIEQVLRRDPRVSAVRLNMTTRRLALAWQGDHRDADSILAPVVKLGYRLAPYDPRRLDAASAAEEGLLLRAMAVAGFGAANIMLLSVSVWAGHVQDMGPATRDLMHWLSALVALPVIAYAGRPFFASALAALRGGRTNMDVPISLGVILATMMSLAETWTGGSHAYFDAAVALLFFLLIGRTLDARARGKARSAAERLVALQAIAATVIDASGLHRRVAAAALEPGMRVLVAAGERVPADGRVLSASSELDISLLNGETVPQQVGVNDRVFAGTVNLGQPLTLEVSAVGEGTLLAEIVRLMEAAEQGRARHVAIADRVSRLYAPVVHAAALATFLGWWLGVGAPWQPALLNAIAVLIVTCPCALALAVPVVQIVACGRLLRRGILVKSPTALERLARVDTVVFDKTGTLTTGRLELVGAAANDDLHVAASLAAASRHPLARALVRAAPAVVPAPAVREVAGQGLSLSTPQGEIRLGSRRWCGVDEGAAAGPELWLAQPGRTPIRFALLDRPRTDAADTVDRLKRSGLDVELLSGDRAPTVSALAAQLGIARWQAELAPADKVARLATLNSASRRTLMVGDGLNDAPALAAASVSMSPASAADISQTAADLVFQGERLDAVREALDVARRAERLVRQNFGLALAYNLLTVPLAVMGLVTPLVAAIAMSTSSLVVIANSCRLMARSSAP